MAGNEINVSVFGEEIGRLGLSKSRISFQYHPEFLNSNKYPNLFPKTGIIRKISQVQIFEKYNNETFKGLAPQFADSLPDMFGSLIFKTWLESKKVKEISVLEQLAYLSNRGMGALEYYPGKTIPKDATVDLDEIIEVLKSVLATKKSKTQKALSSKSLINIFKIGTSAGGARPKILISEHKQTGKVIPGDLEYSDEYAHYLVKLAIENDGYPREIIEFCYHLILKEIGIEMMEAKLIEDKHFATLRYDRQHGEKQHVLTVSGITGWDFKGAAYSSYENLFKLSSFLNITQSQIDELYKRMIFNVVFRNTDDHFKNHSFIYDKQNDSWSLSPAYDITYAVNPLIDFKTTNRALSINNKRNNIVLKDVLTIADTYTIKNPKRIIEEVQSVMGELQEHLKNYDVPQKITKRIMGRIQALK